MDLSNYDFIDFGASKGGCIEFSINRLDGKRGVGIDIDPKKVIKMRNLGYDCILGDVTKLDFQPKTVRFVTMSHVLEHLPDLQTIELTIKSAANVASDFLFIQGPFFDADKYLEDLGLKFYWSDWYGHPLHITTNQLNSTLNKLGLEDHLIVVRESVPDSSHTAIHSINSPRDQHEYDANLHPKKPLIKFDKSLYKEIVCYVKLKPMKNWNTIIQARKGCCQLESHF